MHWLLGTIGSTDEPTTPFMLVPFNDSPRLVDFSLVLQHVLKDNHRVHSVIATDLPPVIVLFNEDFDLAEAIEVRLSSES
jgi:hypothetical protein